MRKADLFSYIPLVQGEKVAQKKMPDCVVSLNNKCVLKKTVLHKLKTFQSPDNLLDISNIKKSDPKQSLKFPSFSLGASGRAYCASPHFALVAAIRAASKKKKRVVVGGGGAIFNHPERFPRTRLWPNQKMFAVGSGRAQIWNKSTKITASTRACARAVLALQSALVLAVI